jgi:hypothetical protein
MTAVFWEIGTTPFDKDLLKTRARKVDSSSATSLISQVGAGSKMHCFDAAEWMSLKTSSAVTGLKQVN